MTIITYELAHDYLIYDPAMGEFWWKIDRNQSVRAGMRAGSPTNKGYRSILIERKKIEEHRLAWLMVHGEQPAAGMYIDHINRNRSDNRIQNLRVVDPVGSAANRVREVYKSGNERGIAFNRSNGKWQVSVPITNRKSKYIGCYDDIHDARIARDAADRAVRFVRMMGIDP
jgi:hypothetical protein